MLFVIRGTIHRHLSGQDRLNMFGRRAEWKYPKNVKVVGEYWTATAPHLNAIVDTDQYEPIMSMATEWGDLMEFNVAPAIAPEDGLDVAKKLRRK